MLTEQEVGLPFVLDALTAPGTSLFRSVIDASPDCIKIIELDGSLSFMNRNGQCAMEIDGFDLFQGKQWHSLWPVENQDQVLAALRAAKRGEAARFEAYCPTAKGSPRWWDVSVAPVPGIDGLPAQIISISRDVTDRVEREHRIAAHERQLERLALAQAATLEEKETLLREKDLLMREIDHRVKNSLALVTSILNVQSRAETDERARAAIARASQRVSTIASIHERLYKGEQSGTLEVCSYVQALCADLENSLADGLGIRIESVGQIVEMDADRATVIGLIASELVTNAVRHAFGEEGGVVRVRVEPRPRDGFCLTVHDDGVGLPEGFDPARAGGLGMKVIQSYVRKHDWVLQAANEDGARFLVQTR